MKNFINTFNFYNSFGPVFNSVIIGLLVTSFFFINNAIAAPPASPYAPNETLSPNCAPGDTNCIVNEALFGPWISNSTSIFTTSSNVGINTTSPDTALEINGDIKNNSTLFTDTANNRVGVGIETPTTPLDVDGIINTSNALSFPDGIAQNRRSMYPFRYGLGTAVSNGDTTSTQDSFSTGITFNNNGTKMYEIGNNSDKIYEYELSTAYDITSANFTTSISTRDSQPRGITFNNNGTKMYEIGYNSDKIYEYNLSTPYDITSANFATSISTQDDGSTGITFNNDGTKMYEIGLSSDKIYEYNLSAPYDITSANFTTSISTQDAGPRGITFNNDGTKMYEIGLGSDKIYEYDLGMNVPNGNVGIGTNTPETTLEVSGTTTINNVMKLEPRSSAPSGSLGKIYVDSDSNELCFHNGSGWTGLESGGTCN